MDFALPVLVSVDARERIELTLPGHAQRFNGASLARLLDDAALHFMEQIPKLDPTVVARYVLCPHVELRKVKVTVPLPGDDGRERERERERDRKDQKTWSGRVSVVLERWREDDFHVCFVPRLATEPFALSGLGGLDEALASFLGDHADKARRTTFDDIACRRDEYLEILRFDADLPTVLPSQPIARRARKKKAKAPQPKPREEKRTLIPPVTLRSVGVDLTHRALDGRLGRAFGRDPLVGEIKTELGQHGAALLLVGAGGVGKTAVVHEVVRRMAAESTGLRDRRDVWQVDANRIISGMSIVGAWEQRVTDMVRELSLRQDVLYVDDLPALVYTGRSAHGESNVAEVLVPHLSRGELRIIGECTPERLASVRDEAPGFFARFRVIQVPPLSERETIGILARLGRALAEEEELSIPPATLEAVLALTRRFEARRPNPGRAAALLDRVIGDHTRIAHDALGRRVIGRREVLEHYERSTGLPGYLLSGTSTRPHKELLEHFSSRIIAQPKAVEVAAEVVSVLEQGLNDPSRPIATFLFVGPTGVGKTETAKALAEFLFGSPDRMLRFDMSELMSAWSVARLIGDRWNPEGELTRRVEQQRFAVILFDEIEKAHPAVFDALLQVLGEGRLTNAAGRTVDFSSTVVVMTSNLGVREAGHRIGFDDGGLETLAAHYTEAARRHFRPEFFNRIDRVVPFQPLGRDAIAPLVERLLGSMLSRRGLVRSSVLVEVDAALVDRLIDVGFDPRYGARSIKRVLEQKLAVPLAEHLVRGRGRSLTLAELFPSGDTGVEMRLSWPEPAQRPTIERPVEVRDWTELEQRHARLAKLLERLEQDPGWIRLKDEHAALVEGFNRGALDDAASAGLTAASASLSERTTIERGLAELWHDHVSPDPFVESVEQEGPYDSWNWKHTKTLVAPTARLVRVDRGPLRTEVKEKLRALELRFASILQHLETARERPSRPALVLFQPFPAGAGARGGEAALELGNAFLHTWSTRGSCRLFFRPIGGGWRLDVPHDQKAAAIAVELVGPGVLAWIEEETGWWLFSDSASVEASHLLVRVEEVGDGSDPIDRLQAIDRETDERRRRRREDPNAAPPLGDLPLRRAFVGARSLDEETGVTLDRTQLGQGLTELALTRSFARFNRPRVVAET